MKSLDARESQRANRSVRHVRLLRSSSYAKAAKLGYFLLLTSNLSKQRPRRRAKSAIMSLGLVVSIYQKVLEPLPAFVWLTGTPISAFDVAAALRLCIILRQLRESSMDRYIEQVRKGEVDVRLKEVEEPSLVKSIATTLVVVYGGEAIMSALHAFLLLKIDFDEATDPWMGLQPSFVFSPVVPGLYAALTVLVERLPWLPKMSIRTEFPLSFMDGMTRAFLLCQLIPPTVISHMMPAISDSPWTLLLSSLVSRRSLTPLAYRR